MDDELERIWKAEVQGCLGLTAVALKNPHLPKKPSNRYISLESLFFVPFWRLEIFMMLSAARI
jgi:hypothetical protein